MPFGLINAPAVFQALINDVLRHVINKHFVYLDDIKTISETLEQHIQHVRQVLQWLLENHLFYKAETCEFHQDTVKVLEFIISKGCLEMDPLKTQVVNNWPIPTNRKEVQHFMGLAYFYCCFIRNYSSTANLLTALTSTKSRFQFKRSWYFMPCTLTRFPEPFEERETHNITEPPPYLQVNFGTGILLFTPNPPVLVVQKLHFRFIRP